MTVPFRVAFVAVMLVAGNVATTGIRGGVEKVRSLPKVVPALFQEEFDYSAVNKKFFFFKTSIFFKNFKHMRSYKVILNQLSL